VGLKLGLTQKDISLYNNKKPAVYHKNSNNNNIQISTFNDLCKIKSRHHHHFLDYFYKKKKLEKCKKYGKVKFFVFLSLLN
jgi:hypothetical protein